MRVLSPTITGPHYLQPQTLDLGVHEESEDETGVYESPPGAEMLQSNDDMDDDNEMDKKLSLHLQSLLS